METLGGLPGAGGAAGREDELESLGLGLFDVDVDLAECFENCPEWNDPLFDTSVLDDLRDCLSDDLWSSPDLQLLTEGDGGAQTESQIQAGPSFIATPPLSPESALSPTPSVASSTLSFSSSDLPTPQKVPSAWNGIGLSQTGVTGAPAQNGIVPTQTPAAMAAQQQGTGWNMPHTATSPAAVQVLKSGEVVHMMKVSPQQMQQSAGVLRSPPPDLTPPSSVEPAQTNTGLPPVTGAASTSVTPGAGASGGGVTRKRQHPDSGAGGDAAGGGVNAAQLSKKQQRLIKNREAASASRQKKKEYVQTLEGRLREAAHKNTTLLQENESLRKQVLQLQAENKVLRVSLSQSGGSSLLTLHQKPALVMVLCLCFVSLLFLPKLTHLSHLVSSPGPTTTTALSVTQSSHVPGRALLEYKDTTGNNPAVFASSLERRLEQPNSQRTSTGLGSSSALVPVSTTVADRHTIESLDRKLQELRRLYAAMPCPPLPPVPSVCSCPAINDTSNSTALRLLSEEMTECFKWYEEHHPRWLHPNRDTQTDTQTENSLAVVVDSNTASLLRNSGDYQITELRDMPLLYKSFKKFFTRKLDTFYLISFKDHLLMDAPLHNATGSPILSVIVPTQGFSHEDTFPMLQMDCQILNTNIIHLPRAAV